MKPDIVAPGTHVTGGVAQNSPPPSPSGKGSAISCFNASGVCGLPGSGTTANTNNFFPLGQQFYTVSSGTSHSTPAVAGACALVRQYFINNGQNAPSPAMTKACLMNSARYLNGVSANDTLWSPNQGMGEVNLGVAFDGTARILRDQLSADKFTASGQSRMFVATVADPTKPFRATLAWTDAPGSTTASSALDNDLDLTVTIGGNTYLGNVFNGAFSTTGGTADSANNVESVFLPAGVTGNITVTVTAANINSDGVTNGGPLLEQDFALVIYNATQAAVPVIAVDSYAVVGENCYPTNAAVDPGETVTVNFSLKNVGTANTTNLVVTLLATNGVTQPNGSQTYGALVAGGADVTRPYSFTANGDCGSSISATFQLQDGTDNLGTAVFSIPLGQPLTVFTQNFDGVTAPTLPSGWTSSASNAQSAWVTSTVTNDTPPNSVFSPDPASIGINQLVSPSITLPADSGQLSFRNNFNLESSSANANLGYDGGVLEIKIGSGSFTDILTAGGSFAAGGYTRTISANYGNPLAGRQAWSGNSGGFITTIVNLPSSAAGQTVQFRWLCGSDNSVSKTGWYLDTIAITGHTCCSNIVNLADLAIGETILPAALNLSSILTVTLNVTNFGPNAASGVTVTDALPAGLSFLSASSSQGTTMNTASLVTCALGTMTNGATATISIHASATVAGLWTNTASVSSGTLDPVNSNNSASASVSVNSPPTISTIPNLTTNENAVAGPIGFTIGDAETPASALTLIGASFNTNLVPTVNIVFGGSGSNRTATITPATNQTGAATITVTVSDGIASNSTAFTLTVNPLNHPPTLAPIANQTIYALMTLTITNSASDTDSPPQTLTFSLVTNVPAGAAINPTSGVFTWTPGETYTNTTNSVTVRVTDNGVPPLSDAKSFLVVVSPPPVIQSVALSNDVVTLTWSAIAGQSYQMQYKTNLTDTNWTDVAGNVTAVGALAAGTNIMNSAVQQFYRVMVLP